MPKILILCTGNSCRSQMAEGFLRSLDDSLKVFSAGTKPAGAVHLKAVQVMKESGIDISGHYPKNAALFKNDNFDYVITVCGSAKETCQVFTGRVRHQIHIGFDDPAKAVGPDDKIIREFRRVRDEIREKVLLLYKNNIKV